MERKIVITKLNEQICTTWIEDGRVVEFHVDPYEQEQVALGDIYVGRVKKVVENIGAAFIEVKPGVECYYDLSSNPSPIFTKKIGKKSLCQDEELLVQVEKEAVKTKVPTVTSNISFPGKYVVLTSGEIQTGVSRKLKTEEREALFEILEPYKNKDYGIIARTCAKDAKKELLIQELEQLKESLESLISYGTTRKVFSCLRKSPPAYITNIQDVPREGLSQILVEEPELYHRIKEYMGNSWLDGLSYLTFYEDPTLSLHKLYNLDQELKRALSEHVWLKTGAYLVIQPTEALTVIDVNTGKSINKKSKEEQHLAINLQAAVESARQIRLRNLSGMILIDFINLKQKEKMQEVLDVLTRELRKDRMKARFIDVTKLQLVEITRQKKRRSLRESICISKEAQQNE